METFRQTEHYDLFYRQPGISDRMWVVFPVNGDAESYFVFDAYDDGRRFSTQELYMAAEALRGIKWFHRLQLLSHGLGICDAPLTQPERRILPELLSGASEKVIAHRLNLTQGTVHQYVTSVYRKFGVRGRAEFMALWLRGRRRPPASQPLLISNCAAKARFAKFPSAKQGCPRWRKPRLVDLLSLPILRTAGTALPAHPDRRRR